MNRYAVIVVPMLNPDGVIDGQYRCCSVVGEDLNRRWLIPNEQRHPSIFHAKNLAIMLSKRAPGLVFYCDFHGHSTKHKAFMYGCDASVVEILRGSAAEPRPETKDAVTRFPTLLASLSPAFSLAACDFRVDRCKQTTGRVVIAIELGVKSSYTLEVSFLGGRLAGHLVHFNQEDLQAFGKQFGEALALHHISENAFVPGLGDFHAIRDLSTSPRIRQLSQECDTKGNCAVAVTAAGPGQGGSNVCVASDSYSDNAGMLENQTSGFDPISPHTSCISQQKLGTDDATSMHNSTDPSDKTDVSSWKNLKDLVGPPLGRHDSTDLSNKSAAGNDDSLSSAGEDEDESASSVTFSGEEDNGDFTGLQSVERCANDCGQRNSSDLAECDAQSLLLLRFAEPNTSRYKLVRSQTDLSSPPTGIHGIGAHAGHRSPGLGRLRTAAAAGALLICGAGVSRSATRSRVEEKAQTTAPCREARGLHSLQLSPPRGSLTTTLSHVPARRSAPAAIGSSVFGLGGVRYSATPPRCIGQRLGNDRSPPRSNVGFKDISPARISVAARSVAGLGRLSVDDRIRMEQSCAVMSPDETLNPETDQCSQLCSKDCIIQGWEGDCLRYAAEALGEAGASKDSIKFSGSRQSTVSSCDVECELPPPLPGLFAMSNPPAAAKLLLLSEAGVNAAALARWSTSAVTNAADLNSSFNQDRSPWRPGVDCSMESIAGSNGRPSETFPTIRGEYEGSRVKETQSIAHARNTLRRILMRETSTGINHEKDTVTDIQCMDRGHPVSNTAGYRIRNVANSRPAQVAHKLGRMPMRGRPTQFVQGSEVVNASVAPQLDNDTVTQRPCYGRDSIASESLEWIGGCGGKVRSHRVWKHPMLATPLLSSQISPQAQDLTKSQLEGNLPPIISTDHDNKKAGFCGPSRIPTATLTLY